MIIEKLRQLERESIRRGIPIIGPEVGTWLSSILGQHKPTRILEIGTANGYSGCILGSEGAHLTTIEINSQIAKEARRNFAQFHINATVIVGDGVQEIKKLATPFDLIFIDFAKKKYIEVLEPSLHLLNQGGIMIADNVTFEDCQDFKKAVLAHPLLKTSLIKIRTGLSYSEKVNT